jgi:hypothetical protein
VSIVSLLFLRITWGFLVSFGGNCMMLTHLSLKSFSPRCCLCTANTGRCYKQPLDCCFDVVLTNA